jgi:hypothetical protein
MTPLHFQKMKDYIGIDVEPCFSELKKFKAYIYLKIVHFDPKYLYVTKRGSHKDSIDYFLYKTALGENVHFEFSHPLTPNIINSIPNNSIIATGSYSSLYKQLGLRHTPFIHLDSYIETQEKNNFCIAYFDTYLAGYGYGYIASKGGLASVELDFLMTQPYEKYLKKFEEQLKKTENLEFGSWAVVTDYIPGGIHLFKKLHGKTFILAGAISGFHDPFFGFGVNSALISGKIAAMSIISKKKGLQEFKQFRTNLRSMFLLSKVYHHLPLKKIFIPQLFRSTKSIVPIIGMNLQSVPGFTHEDCFKIIHVEQ